MLAISFFSCFSPIFMFLSEWVIYVCCFFWSTLGHFTNFWNILGNIQSLTLKETILNPPPPPLFPSPPKKNQTLHDPTLHCADIFHWLELMTVILRFFEILSLTKTFTNFFQYFRKSETKGRSLEGLSVSFNIIKDIIIDV